ncbi:hypothetical protein AKJ16_DCAP23854 [Drosera capensis]
MGNQVASERRERVRLPTCYLQQQGNAFCLPRRAEQQRLSLSMLNGFTWLRSCAERYIVNDPSKELVCCTVGHC